MVWKISSHLRLTKFMGNRVCKKKTSQKICPLCAANLAFVLNLIPRVEDCLALSSSRVHLKILPCANHLNNIIIKSVLDNLEKIEFNWLQSVTNFSTEGRQKEFRLDERSKITVQLVSKIPSEIQSKRTDSSMKWRWRILGEIYKCFMWFINYISGRIK